MSVTVINPFLAGTASVPAVFPTTGLIISFDPHDTGHRSIISGKFRTITDPISGTVLNEAYGGGTGSHDPPLVAADLNGFDVMDLSGQGGACVMWDRDTTAGAAAPIKTASSTYVVVAKNITTAGGPMQMGRLGGAQIEAVAFGSGGHARLGMSVGASSANSSTDDWTGNYEIQVIVVDHTGHTAKLYQNQTAIGSPNVTLSYSDSSGNSTAISIGEFEGRFAFGCMFDHAFNSSELSNAVGALGVKYGITVV